MNIKHAVPLLLLLSVLLGSTVRAEVMITPTRVVLEPGQRSAKLIIVNRGNEEAAFRISIENRRMTLNGSLELVETARPNEYFAKDYIRFSPRRVILQAGQNQTIRVSMKTTGLKPGEYRSHLRLMSAPTSAGRKFKNSATNTSDNISVQLIAIRSLTIPIIAKVGNVTSNVELTSARLKTITHNSGDTVLDVHMQRKGSGSSYGDLDIYVNDQPKPVFRVRGIAVYTPNESRIVSLPLPTDVSEKISSQPVRIVYHESNVGDMGTMSEISTVLN